MIVPRHWAEAKRSVLLEGHRTTIRRFGWSDIDLASAERHADDRVEAAARLAIEGTAVLIREPKVAYNGADGVPIREEIIDQTGAAILTRNNYGALCINTPNVLIADIDVDQPTSLRPYAVSVLIVAAVLFLLAWQQGLAGLSCPIVFVSIMIGPISTSLFFSMRERCLGDAPTRARRRVERFADKHPDWHLRLYRTPAGYRVIVMHTTFEPCSEVVRRFFRDVGSDPVYVRMCEHQSCFRARVSPKPWRVGLARHLKPRPGVWPINPERFPDRQRWVADYERRCQGYAACRFERRFGSSSVAPVACDLQRWHDELCGSDTNQPIA